MPVAPAKTGFARRRDGGRLYFEVGGPEGAPPLLLIRGLARSSSYWLEFRELLERERRLVVFDNRGVGRSDTPKLFWTTADMADDAALVLEASGVERADVFGISLGGMIAQQLTLRHPHRVGRLVLACTSPGGPDAETLSPRAALALARASRKGPRAAQAENARWVLSPRYLEERPDIVDIWASIAESEPRSVRGLLGQVAAGARHDAWRLLPHLEHATLVLTGDADRLMPPANSERLARRLPNASLDYVRGAGHDFPTERPVETAERVLAFCRGPGTA
ncbi:MAG: alpha/beta fold hydrolase [Sandaracinaceae bacterium]|nr:alpha/beta fold hydrolase [Sandaracinaceae bacterium]